MKTYGTPTHDNDIVNVKFLKDNITKMVGGSNFNIFSIIENKGKILINGYGNMKTIKVTAKPLTTYTASTNMPMTSGENALYNLFVDNIKNNPSSTLNGISSNRSYTFTTDSTGEIRISGRDEVVESYYTDLNKLFDGTFWLKIEEGTQVTPHVLAIKDQQYLINEMAKLYLYK